MNSITMSLSKMSSQKVAWILKEIKYLTSLALPTSIICLSEGLQMKLSNIFIGRASGSEVSTELSALFIGQVAIMNTAYPITEGLAICVNILCSQAHGAKQHRLVELYYYRAMMLMILLCFPLFSLYVSVDTIVYHVTQSWELALGAGRYTSIFCFGFPAYAYYKMSVCYLQSQHIVWVPLMYLLIANLINGILQYILILHLNLGIAGASVAYVISLHLCSVLIFGHIRLFCKDTPQVGLSIDLISELYHTIQYVVPPMLQTLTAATTTNIFPIILLLLINNDKNQLAIFSIMYSVWFAFSLFTIGYSSAITVRVGSLLGAGDTTRAKRSAIFGIVFAEIILLCMCIIVVLCSRPLSYLFTTDEKFVEELYFNLKFLPVICFSDVLLFGQGVMNVCGMQHTGAVIKFVLIFVIGFILEFFLVRYVSWKALLLFTIQGILLTLCFVIFMFLLLLRDWNTFKQKAIKNAQIRDYQEIEDDSHSLSTNFLTTKLKNISESRIFVVSSYVLCILLGVSLFIAATLRHY